MEANYSLSSNALLVSSAPVIVSLCVREATIVPSNPNMVGLQLGGAELPIRLCALMGVRTDPRDGSRIASVDVDTEDFIGACPDPQLPPPPFPTQLEVDDYVPRSSTGVDTITRCPPGATSMPSELQGSGVTSATVLPFDFILPIGFNGFTTIDAGSVLQDLLSGSAFIKLCAHDSVRYSGATPAGSGAPPPPPSAPTTAAFGWYAVKFGDPAVYKSTSTCALMARVPSKTVSGRDDMVAAIGQPGAPCPTSWAQASTQYAVTFPGFYTPLASGSVRTAVSWAQLSATLLVCLLGMALLSPAPVL